GSRIRFPVHNLTRDVVNLPLAAQNGIFRVKTNRVPFFDGHGGQYRFSQTGRVGGSARYRGSVGRRVRDGGGARGGSGVRGSACFRRRIGDGRGRRVRAGRGGSR